jgi:hypothetical protein
MLTPLAPTHAASLAFSLHSVESAVPYGLCDSRQGRSNGLPRQRRGCSIRKLSFSIPDSECSHIRFLSFSVQPVFTPLGCDPINSTCVLL